MTKPLPPERWQELAAGYVFGNLNSEEAEQFQQILASNPELETEVTSLQETLAMMPSVLPEPEPPARLRENILKAASKDLIIKHNQQKQSIQLGKNIFALLAASVAIVLGINNYVLRQQLNLARTQLEQQIALSPQIFDPGNESATKIVFASESFLNNNWNGLNQLLEDHLHSLLSKSGSVELASSNANEIAQRFSSQFMMSDRVPLLKDGTVKLLGGSFCQFTHTKGIRFTYQLANGETVSLYQLERPQQSSFPHLSGEQLLYIGTLVQPNLFIWSDRDFFYALVAPLSPQELDKLAAKVEHI